MRVLRTHHDSFKGLFYPRRRVFLIDQSAHAPGQPLDTANAATNSAERVFRTIDQNNGGTPNTLDVTRDAFAEAERVSPHRIAELQHLFGGNAAMLQRLDALELESLRLGEASEHAQHATDAFRGERRGIIRGVWNWATFGNARAATHEMGSALEHVDHSDKFAQRVNAADGEEAVDLRVSTEATLTGLQQNPNISWVFEQTRWQAGGDYSTAHRFWESMPNLRPAPAGLAGQMVRLEQYVALTELLKPDELALIQHGEFGDDANPKHIHIRLLLLHLADQTMSRERMYEQQIREMSAADARTALTGLINVVPANPNAINQINVVAQRLGIPQINAADVPAGIAALADDQAVRLAIELTWFDAATGRPNLQNILGSGTRMTDSVFAKLAKEKGGLVIAKAEGERSAALGKVAKLKYDLGAEMTAAEYDALDQASRDALAALNTPVVRPAAANATARNPNGIGARIENIEGGTFTANETILNLRAAQEKLTEYWDKRAEVESLWPDHDPNAREIGLSGAVNNAQAAFNAAMVANPNIPHQAEQRQLDIALEKYNKHRQITPQLLTLLWNAARSANGEPLPAGAVLNVPAAEPAALDRSFIREIGTAVRFAEHRQTSNRAVTPEERAKRDTLTAELKTAEDALKIASDTLAQARTATARESLEPGKGATAREITLAIIARDQVEKYHVTDDQAKLSAERIFNGYEAATICGGDLQHMVDTADRVARAERREASTGTQVEAGLEVGKGTLVKALKHGLAGLAVGNVPGALLGIYGGVRGGVETHFERQERLRMNGKKALMHFLAGDTGEPDAHGHDEHHEGGHAHLDTTKYAAVVGCIQFSELEKLVNDGKFTLEEAAGLHTFTEEAIRSEQLSSHDVVIYSRLHRFTRRLLIKRMGGVEWEKFVRSNGKPGLYEKISKKLVAKAPGVIGRVWGKWKEGAKTRLKKAETGAYTLPGDAFNILSGAMLAALPFSIGKTGGGGHGGGH